MTRLIFGCGYLGIRVARRWLAEGGDVFAVTRSAERAAELQRLGIAAVPGDVTRPESFAALPVAETVLYAIGYDRRSEASREEVYVEGLRAALGALPRETGRIVYISSTGVYGDTAGRPVDEESPCHPNRESGRAILAAEHVLRQHPLGRQAVILRLAGIYGPDRIPRIADLLAGRPLSIPRNACLNLIHVDDAATAVLSAESRGCPGAVYNVSDGHPCGRRDFYRYLARRLQLPEPEFVEPSADEAARQRAGVDKRVSNARMLAEFGIELRYPSFREGLSAVTPAAD